MRILSQLKSFCIFRLAISEWNCVILNLIPKHEISTEFSHLQKIVQIDMCSLCRLSVFYLLWVILLTVFAT